MPVSVVIVDEREMVRECLGAALGAAGFLVLGSVATQSEGMQMAGWTGADLLIINAGDDPLDAVQIGLKMKQLAPACRSVVLAERPRHVLAASLAGVRGYLLWSQGVESIVEALRSVAAGEVRFCANPVSRATA